MNQTSASMTVAMTDGAVWVRISGRANFVSSVDFKKLIHELRQRGHRRFILDLKDCLIMDSTFLGVLARIGMELGEPKTPTADCAADAVELLNPNPRISDLLDNLGVLPLFRVARGSSAENLTYEAVDSVSGQTSKVEMSRNCLEAHQTLMSLNPANEAKFKDVAKFLAEDLKRAESGASEGHATAA
jgi:anti-anti-sigma factor